MLLFSNLYNKKSDKSTAEAIFAKYRNGAIGTVDLKWDGAIASFRNRTGGQAPSRVWNQDNKKEQNGNACSGKSW